MTLAEDNCVTFVNIPVTSQAVTPRGFAMGRLRMYATHKEIRMWLVGGRGSDLGFRTSTNFYQDMASVCRTARRWLSPDNSGFACVLLTL